MNEQPFEEQSLDRPDAAIGHETVPARPEPEPDFTALDEWMDAELEKLVARWVHLAAPNASRIRLGKRL